ncbi:Membrane protein insertase YidC [Candidatus Venteria ishoeyi]|uniref:Membrane protein insertase YidC n=2 Tax=Candidatus Venteria ishoeyi TaxID=1899563 RepID=A0A1H6F8N1_9GAMM|nr:Membrane protein insertase YidC [Candidatus Venteria ishoeyi]
MKPSEEEIAEAKRKQDSISVVRQDMERERMLELEKQKSQSTQNTDQLVSEDEAQEVKDERLKSKFGEFSLAATGEQEFTYLENDVLRLKISNKGGRVYSTELKDFQTHDSLPLILFDGDSTVFGFDFFTRENLAISTNNLFFSSQNSHSLVVAESSPKSLTMRLMVSNNSYIDYIYTLEPGSYMVDFDVRLVGMNEVLASNQNFLDLKWQFYVPGQEKGRKFEDQYSTIYFKHKDDEVDYLSETKDDDSESIPTKVKWISYKQQFFATTLIADNFFLNADINQNKTIDDPKYLKFYQSAIGVPFNNSSNESINMQFYFGPTHYTSLKKFDLDLEQMVPLGWGIFGWVNRFAIIPVFNFLGSFISNYGIIILLLTILIKLVLFPLTYKSYMSSAKMRVLKPQVEELTKNIPKEKSMEKQQKTMEFYKKAGVNPMGGCLPMALQMPILIAMFRFFPASIELRQQSFLWATDLSSYDSIVSWTTHIPLLSDFYGNHISLFTLLMTISTIFYTRLNQSQMGDMNSQMPGMKTMMYFFPVMMLFWFNSYASGLSYYYLVANLITFGQMFLIKRFVDEKAIIKQMESNKKKPVKKSNFQARLEKMQKERTQATSKKKK